MPTRRILLKHGALAAFSATVFSIAISRPAAAAMAMMSKKLAAYQDTPRNGEQCSACCMFVPGDPGHCTMIEGDISPHGWCKFWQAGPNDTCS
ncbi:MAG: high-potential iron-sulfur protein [Rhodospirillales bacterium]|nr:high-potential iron-sulfur protein [Rhodospirillales bacterium]